jgi:glycosyltransferase involved in cell wall biosynthesis
LRADKLIAISENEAQYFKDHKNIEIIPNPIDFKIIDQIKLKNEICIQPEYGKVFVGMTGSFYGLKGHINFLKALEYLVNFQSFKEVKFFIVGSKFTPLFRKIIKRLLNLKDYGKELEDFISKHKLKHYITFLPYTRNVLKYLNNMDIVVRPADTADPWGRDIIEAMALGKPVVATGSSEFYIENGKNGYLVPPNDPEALANKIISLVSSKSLRIEFGNKSYKKVKFMCNVNEHTKKIENAYKALLNN